MRAEESITWLLTFLESRPIVSIMSKTRERFRGPVVPRSADNPIDYLLESTSIVDLAVEWKLKSTDAIYRLKRFEYVPRYRTAEKMAESFGWSAGEVMDFWAQRVEA